MTIIVLLTPRLQTPEWRTFRLGVFCMMGLSGFIPMVDSLITYGWEYSARFSIDYYLFEMLLEVCGAMAYGFRIPEKYWPGRFDILGASHQWFHMFSATAAMVHLAGLINAVRNTRGWERCRL